MEQTRAAREPLRIGVVGAGRSRNGIGPFLAQAFEREGARVAAVAGRGAARAEANATALAGMLGHPVAAFADERELSRSDIDVMVIASPTTAHAAGLEAALDAGLACFCEKPIADLADVDDALAVLGRFASGGIAFAENAQWPYVLPVVDEAHGHAARGTRVRLEVGLSPIDSDPLQMAKESLPHLVSMAWALAAPRPGDSIGLRSAQAVSVRDGELVVESSFDSATVRVDARLNLAQCVEQPRPAWLSVDGRRIDRRIGPGYTISFVGGGREIAVVDPLQSMVGGFVRECRQPKTEASALRRHAATMAAGERLRLWRDMLRRLFG